MVDYFRDYLDRHYHKCDLCPRMCGIDRTEGEKGFCGMSDRIKVARAALHYWEEPGISAGNKDYVSDKEGSGADSSGSNDELQSKAGSGTIFFSGCNLRCIY
ncbi:MAG: hypothetical protein K6G57_00005, partial [Lachnospiraceae bacterium]|nr:hypothetical protein [Lachnospiraceae bacterium]